VKAELLPLLSSWSIASNEDQAQEIAQIRDVGEDFEISIVGDTRRVSDVGRDCEEHARVAAVIIALRLEPLSSEETPQVSIVESEPLAPAESAPSTGLDLGMGMLVQKSLDGRGGPGAGPAFSLSLSWQNWLLLSSAAVQSSYRLAEAETPVTVTRFPLDLGVGRRIPVGDFALEPSLLVAFDNFRSAASHLESAAPRGRLEVGPRARVRLVYRRSALFPFASAGLSYFPRDYSVRIDPLGQVARTPHVYIDASVGFFVPLFGR